MEKTIPPYLQRSWRVLRPWLVLVAVLAALRYTGILAGISQVAGSVLLSTGLMDASPNAPAVLRKFDYDFRLRDLDGNAVHAATLAGKTLFVNVWATWCGPCRIEMPSIQRLYNAVDTSRVAFVMLSVDHSADVEKVRTYKSRNGFTFPVYMPAGALPEILQVNSIPATFVVAPDGTIVQRETGIANYDNRRFREFIESLGAR